MTEPINLTTEPAGGHHSADYTITVAQAVAEAVRVLNHATLPNVAAASVPHPATVYDVVGGLATAAARLPQLVDQLAERTGELAAEAGDRLYVSHGAYEGRPAAAVVNAVAELQGVGVAAEVLAASLKTAHEALSPLGVRDE